VLLAPAKGPATFPRHNAAQRLAEKNAATKRGVLKSFING
jgi:hypothetical protein